MFNRLDVEEGRIHPREDAEEDLDLRLLRCPSRGCGGGRGYILALMRRRAWMCHRVDVAEVMDTPSRLFGKSHGCAIV